MPLPALLEPSAEDVAEGLQSSRGPGVSVWDAARVDHALACWFRGDHILPDEHRSFYAAVRALRDASNGFGAPLDVVSDALPPPVGRVPPSGHNAATIAGAALGHCLLEGILRLDVKGVPKSERGALRKAYYDRLQIVLDCFGATPP